MKVGGPREILQQGSACPHGLCRLCPGPGARCLGWRPDLVQGSCTQRAVRYFFWGSLLHLGAALKLRPSTLVLAGATLVSLTC